MRRFLPFIIGFMALVIFPNSASADVITNGKLITVDTGKQMLYAWDGGQIVHQTKVSTGMKLTPTVKGSFKIQRKVPMQDMRGPSPYKNIYPSGKYYIKDVKYVMYFYQGYAIHAAHWHNNFGVRASHGCVNVPPASAEWLFNWAENGTQIEVF